MYKLEFPNLFLAIHFQNTNTVMDNATGSTIFTQTISMETVTNLKNYLILRNSKSILKLKAISSKLLLNIILKLLPLLQISTYIGVNIFILSDLCLFKLKKKFK